MQLVEKRQEGRDRLIDHLTGRLDAQGRQMEGLAASRAAQAAQLKAAQASSCAAQTDELTGKVTMTWTARNKCSKCLPMAITNCAGHCLCKVGCAASAASNNGADMKFITATRFSRALQDALVDVEANLEAVEAEKKRLLAQWRASLAALRVRDDNLQVAALLELDRTHLSRMTASHMHSLRLRKPWRSCPQGLQLCTHSPFENASCQSQPCSRCRDNPVPCRQCRRRWRPTGRRARTWQPRRKRTAV